MCLRACQVRGRQREPAERGMRGRRALAAAPMAWRCLTGGGGCNEASSSARDKAVVFSAGLQERKETVRGVYSVIDQLSRTHLSTLERLIFHLVRYTGLVGRLQLLIASGRGKGAAFIPGFSSNPCIYLLFFFRIALQEETNRMSANALAIVFAPCILRCPDTTDPLQSVQDISKTTT